MLCIRHSGRDVSLKNKETIYYKWKSVSLWTTQLSNTQRNTEALNSYMALLPKQETSIHSHQQARLSEGKIQMMVTTQLIRGQSPFEAFSLSVLGWLDSRTLLMPACIITDCTLCAKLHNTRRISTSSGALFGSTDYFICWSETCSQIDFSSLKATDRLNVHR